MAASATCGPGTLLNGTQCVAPPTITCAPGAVLSGTRCIALPAHDGGMLAIRLPAATVPANGYARIPVVSIGALLDGTPSTEPVVVAVSPPTAGTVAPVAFDLDALGTTSWFTPCRSAVPSCIGTFELTLARASAPDEVIATTGTTSLVAPGPVASAVPCLGEYTLLYLDGDSSDLIHPGMEIIVPRTGLTVLAAPMVVWFDYAPVWDQSAGSYELVFESEMLAQPLAANTYLGAQRAYLNDVGRPGLDISGNALGCNELTGAFQIHHMTWVGARLDDFLATFEQHCDSSRAALRGCVHFRR